MCLDQKDYFLLDLSQKWENDKIFYLTFIPDKLWDTVYILHFIPKVYVQPPSVWSKIILIRKGGGGPEPTYL